jgi:hypothetical protein
MDNMKEQIAHRLSALVGFNLSGAGRAADMLTLQFGPLRDVTTRRGTIKRVGVWSLHIQCGWKIERSGANFASSPDFAVSEDNTRATLERIRELVANGGPFTVNRISVGDNANVTVFMSENLRLVISTDAAPDEEDWRFFESSSSGKHFVIQGGKIDPWSLS